MTPRALYAAGLLIALTGALLLAWFVSGWADVRARQRAVHDAPRLAAEQRGAELAHDLRGELAALIAREVERPYFHYQNLFRDPRASAGFGVAPSPLAHGPDGGLVLGHFQLDAKGQATTPTINDEIPELSEPTRLADNRRFRDEVTRSLVADLAPLGSGPLVAALDTAQPARGAGSQAPARRVVPQAPRPTPSAPPRPAIRQTPRPQVPQAPPDVGQVPPEPSQAPVVDQVLPAQAQQSQVVTIDPKTYAQNNMSNSVYIDQQRAAPAQRPNSQRTRRDPPEPDRHVPALGQTPPPVLTLPSMRGTTSAPSATRAPSITSPAGTPRAPAPRAVRAGGPVRTPASEPQAPVTITVSPLEWRTIGFAGQPAIIAVRQVETPDGRLAQGFVVDRTALTSWLAGHAGDAIAELRTGDNGTTEIVPGWHLEVQANPRALTAAAADASGVARGFLVRFVAIGAIAILAALLVVMLVARAERLARERSQFAAAAAHELRTPLAGLQLYGDMLADGLGDPSKIRDYARRMSEEASRLGRVVSNVLGFSQLERGNLSVAPQVGALGDALRELAERAEPALVRAGAVLALDVAPGLSARFDRDALARIVGNLLDNAEKYSRHAADRTITLSARATDRGAEIAVSDRGPGIAQPARTRLFQPFARGVSPDGPAGLGLGLALSQSLARAMGGELAYRPPAGGGATFVLTLARE